MMLSVKAQHTVQVELLVCSVVAEFSKDIEMRNIDLGDIFLDVTVEPMGADEVLGSKLSKLLNWRHLTCVVQEQGEPAKEAARKKLEECRSLEPRNKKTSRRVFT